MGIGQITCDSCMVVKLWVTPPLLIPIHTHTYTCLYFHGTPSVGDKAHLISTIGLNGHILQSVPAKLVHSFILSVLSYRKVIATCCEVKRATQEHRNSAVGFRLRFI